MRWCSLAGLRFKADPSRPAARGADPGFRQSLSARGASPSRADLVRAPPTTSKYLLLGGLSFGMPDAILAARTGSWQLVIYEGNKHVLIRAYEAFWQGARLV